MAGEEARSYSVFTQYKDIPEFPGYQVGSDGTVRRQLPDGRYRMLKNTLRRKPKRNSVSVNLIRDGHKHQPTLGLLVLTAFGPPRPPGSEVLHFPDPDPTNNRIDNLRWTPKGTCSIGSRRPDFPQTRGSSHPQAKLDEIEVARMRDQFRAGARYADIARSYSMTETSVARAISGKTWKNVPGAVSDDNDAKALQEPTGKLSSRDVKKIVRLMGERRLSLQKIAARYGISYWTVLNIKRGKAHVSRVKDDLPFLAKRTRISNVGSSNAGAKLGVEDVRTIKELRRSGVKLLSLAQRFGVGIGTISKIARGQSWVHVK